VLLTVNQSINNSGQPAVGMWPGHISHGGHHARGHVPNSQKLVHLTRMVVWQFQLMHLAIPATVCPT